jgi:hypothetical protein
MIKMVSLFGLLLHALNRTMSTTKPRLSRQVRALLQAVAVLAIALILYFRFDLRPMAYAIASIAGLTVLCGLCLPGAYRVIERIQSFVGRAVGLGITVALLGVIFALCFIPGRLVLAVRRKDPLRRKSLGPHESLWIDRASPFDPDRYKRQY